MAKMAKIEIEEKIRQSAKSKQTFDLSAMNEKLVKTIDLHKQ